MSQILRQSTQIVVHIGPFVDVGDGFTPETGVTLSGADQAELLKAGATSTTDISGATWAAITGADGWYALTLSTSHTDTVGPLDVIVQDLSVCLPAFARFQVVEEDVFDRDYAANATGIAAGVVKSSCASGSTTTNITTNLTEATDEHYTGRVITWTSGVLAGQSRRILAYNGTTKAITVSATTDAPSSGDTFYIS